MNALNLLMEIDMLVAFVLSAIMTGIVIPQILLIAFRKKLYDTPDERKIHTSAVPRLGGLAFQLVLFFSMFFVIGSNVALGVDELYAFAEDEYLPFCFGICALSLVYMVGMADDLIGVRYRAKFVIQMVCALFLVLGGLYLKNFHGVLFLNEVNPLFGCGVSLLAMVFIINAINLIDGVDGLASGLCMVAFLYYGVVFFALGQYAYALVAYASLGTIVPFYYYNVFGNPEKRTKIFMGDTGALTLGVLLCFLSMKMNQIPDNETVLPNSFVIAFAPLIVPCFDVIRVYIHRVRQHRNPFMPDKNHIHHKIMRCGFSQRVTMVSIIVLSLVVTMVNVLLSYVVDVNLLILLDLALFFGCNGLMNMRLAAIERKEDADVNSKANSK